MHERGEWWTLCLHLETSGLQGSEKGFVSWFGVENTQNLHLVRLFGCCEAWELDWLAWDVLSWGEMKRSVACNKHPELSKYQKAPNSPLQMTTCKARALIGCLVLSLDVHLWAQEQERTHAMWQWHKIILHENMIFLIRPPMCTSDFFGNAWPLLVATNKPLSGCLEHSISIDGWLGHDPRMHVAGYDVIKKGMAAMAMYGNAYRWEWCLMCYVCVCKLSLPMFVYVSVYVCVYIYIYVSLCSILTSSLTMLWLCFGSIPFHATCIGTCYMLKVSGVNARKMGVWPFHATCTGTCYMLMRWCMPSWWTLLHVGKFDLDMSIWLSGRPLMIGIMLMINWCHGPNPICKNAWCLLEPYQIESHTCILNLFGDCMRPLEPSRFNYKMWFEAPVGRMHGANTFVNLSWLNYNNARWTTSLELLDATALLNWNDELLEFPWICSHEVELIDWAIASQIVNHIFCNAILIVLVESMWKGEWHTNIATHALYDNHGLNMRVKIGHLFTQIGATLAHFIPEH